MEKGKNISIRVTEEQYNSLKEKAEGGGFANLSEYARNILLADGGQGISNIGKTESQRLMDINPVACIKARKELTKMINCIESLSGNKGTKCEMKERVEAIWLILN